MTHDSRERSDQLPDARNPLEAGAKGQTVPGVQVPVGNLAQQPFHVVNAFQLLRQGNANHAGLCQRFHGVQPPVDLLPFQQRLLHPAAQQPSAHGGARLVQQVQQRPFLSLPAQALRQLQVPPRVRIQQHPIAAPGKAQRRHVLQAVFLGFPQIFHQRPRRPRREGMLLQPQSSQMRQFEMVAKHLAGVMQLEPVAVLFADHDARKFPGRLLQALPAGADDLRRRRPQNFRPQDGHRRFRHIKLARRNIREGNPCVPAVRQNRHQIVVFPVVQHHRVRHRPRRDHPDHLAFHQSFGQRRILHLLADGNLVSPFDQLLNVRIHAVKRHAAHRRTLFQPAVLSRQRQFQLVAGHLRILKKQLVKIPESEKQQTVRILLMNRKILLHHRRDAHRPSPSFPKS